MPEDLMSRSEVAEYLSISKKRVDSYLEPVRDSNRKPYRIGREFAYLRKEVEEKKTEIERERRKIKKITLRPEDLSSEQKKELDRGAVVYEGTKAAGKAIGVSADTERENIEIIMGKKERYTGDDVIKSLSYGWDTESEVNVKQLLKYIPKSILKEHGILEVKYNVRLAEKKAAELIKRYKLKNVIEKFENFCEDRNIRPLEQDQENFEKTVREFSRKHKTNIQMRYLIRMMKDYKNNRLTERKLADHSRKLAETCVTKNPKTRKLRVTLQDKHRKAIEKIAEEIADESELSKLKEFETKLFKE